MTEQLEFKFFWPLTEQIPDVQVNGIQMGIQELEKILLEAKTDVSGKWISKIHLQELLNKLREKEKANDSD